MLAMSSIRSWARSVDSTCNLIKNTCMSSDYIPRFFPNSLPRTRPILNFCMKDRCGFLFVRYKRHCCTELVSWEHAACPLSAVQNQEASARERLIKHQFCSNFIWCHSQCPLQRGCPLVGGPVMGGSTVVGVQRCKFKNSVQPQKYVTRTTIAMGHVTWNLITLLVSTFKTVYAYNTCSMRSQFPTGSHAHTFRLLLPICLCSKLPVLLGYLHMNNLREVFWLCAWVCMCHH